MPYTFDPATDAIVLDTSLTTSMPVTVQFKFSVAVKDSFDYTSTNSAITEDFTLDANSSRTIDLTSLQPRSHRSPSWKDPDDPASLDLPWRPTAPGTASMPMEVPSPLRAPITIPGTFRVVYTRSNSVLKLGQEPLVNSDVAVTLEPDRKQDLGCQQHG